MTDHLTHEQLLRYLDGEVPRRSSAQIDGHLHACWTCRTEFERLKDDIGTILEAQDEGVLRVVPPPPRPWDRLESLLQDDILPPSRQWWKRFRFMPRLSPVYAWTTISGILTIAIAAWFYPVTVSAKELLSRVSTAEATRLAVQPDRYVHQRVRVREKSKGSSQWIAGDLDSWRSAKDRTYWQISEADRAANDLRSLCQRAQIPTQLPLSAISYEGWRRRADAEMWAANLADDSEIVLRAQKYVGISALQEVRLLVRRGDWRVIEVKMDFADAQFDIIGEDFAVVSWEQVPKGVRAFLDPVSNPRLATRNPLPAEKRKTSVATPSNLDDVEMDVRFTLHQMGSDADEPIEVRKGPGDRVSIDAWGASLWRKEQLQRLFKDRANVVVNLQSEQRPTKIINISSATTAKDTSKGRDDIDRQLVQVFGSPEHLERFTDSALEDSTDLLAHLFSLKELAVRYPPHTEESLSIGARNQLSAILQDHRRASVEKCKALSIALKPLLDRDAPVLMGESGPFANWQAAAHSSLASAKETDRLLRFLLTTTDERRNLEETLSLMRQRLTETGMVLNSMHVSNQ